MSSIAVGGHGDPLLGPPRRQPWTVREDAELTSTLTRLLASHTVKVGGEWRSNETCCCRPRTRAVRAAAAFNASHRPAQRVEHTQRPANAMASF